LSISVIIPSTRLSFRNSIDSVLSQTLAPEQIIVIDDSRDQDLDFVFPNVLVLKTGGLKGVSYSRNVGINHAKGEWLAFLDDDDIWMPLKLELQLRFNFENNLDASFTSCILDSTNEIRPRISYSHLKSPIAQIYDRGFRIRSRFYFGFSSFMVKKNCVMNIRFDEKLSVREDLKFIQEIWNQKRIIGVFENPLCIINDDFARTTRYLKISDELSWARYLTSISIPATFRFIFLNMIRNRGYKFFTAPTRVFHYLLVHSRQAILEFRNKD
jgi:glycosyltransferase involved in cell wall biosynthesis